MKLPGFVTKAAFEIGKHSPVILIGVGVVGVVASAVGACVATKKLDAVMEEHNRLMAGADNENITEVTNQKTGEIIEVDDKFRKQVRWEARKKLAIDLIKIYGIPVLAMILSLTCIVGAHVIMKKRNAMLTAALGATTKAFDEYRNRVKDRFGDEVERQIRYNMQPDGEPITVVDMDENGKSHKSKVQPMAISLDNLAADDGLIYFVRGYSDLWRNSDTYNGSTINGIIGSLQEYMDRERCIVTGNDIRKAFRADQTAKCQGFGYSYKNNDNLETSIVATPQMFIDPVTHEHIEGYVIELNDMHNILDDYEESTKNKKWIPF